MCTEHTSREMSSNLVFRKLPAVIIVSIRMLADGYAGGGSEGGGRATRRTEQHRPCVTDVMETTNNDTRSRKTKPRALELLQIFN